MSSVPTAEVYLAPGFEPSALKVAQLRGILTEHSIPIPSSAKKADLVQLFLDKVKSKARAYHDRAASVVPSTDGIREIDEDGVEMSPEPPVRPLKTNSRTRKATVIQARPLSDEDGADVFTAGNGHGDDYLVLPGGSDDAGRRRTRRMTRSQTPLNAQNSLPIQPPIEGLPSATPSKSKLKHKGSIPSFPEEEEDGEMIVVETPAPKKGGRKSKKSELVDLGLGAELGFEGQAEMEEEGGWEKTPSRKNAYGSSSHTTPTAGQTSSSTPKSKSKLNADSGRAYESPNKYTPLSVSKQHSNGGESGFSDYNPFQSGDGGEEEGAGRKTPRRTKRKTMGERKSSGLNVSATSPEIESPPAAEDDFRASPAKPTTPSPMKSIINFASAAASAVSPVRRSPSPRKIEPDWSSVRTTPEGYARRARGETVSPSKVRFAKEEDDNEDEPGADEEEQQGGFDEGVNVEEEADVKVEQVARSPRRGESSALIKPSTPIKSRPALETRMVKRDAPGALASTPETKIKFSMTMALLGFLIWVYQFQQQSAPLGYCDPGSSTNSIIRAKEARLVKASACVAERQTKTREQAGSGAELQVCPYETELPLFDFVPRADKCTPCPSHALCEDGKVEGCQGDYILEPHPVLNWLNPVLGGLPGVGPVLFPPTCELDVRTKAQIGEIAKKVEERLATRKGEVVCKSGGSRRKRKDGKSEVERFGIGEEELFQHFVRMVKVTPEAFRQNLRAALKDLVVHKNVHHEVIEGRDAYSAVRAEMPASCRLRIAATEQIVDHKNGISLGAFGLALLAYVKSQYQNKRKESAKVKKLVKTALSRLQDQQYTHYIDPVQAPEPFLRPNQLRDFVLDHIHNASTRQRLWARVQPIIETNANVRVGEQEVMGDTWKIWEWIGVSKMDSQLLGDVGGSMYPEAS